MKRLGLLLPAIYLVVGVPALKANIIHVPADSATIQLGIDGTMAGDTVLVADGTYTGEGNRDIDFVGKDIVVMSENGYETTIIDCENSGRGFYFHNVEGRSSIVQGFTIKNGNAVGGYGGGIFCISSSPSILQCYFLSNEATVGGGIGCDQPSMPLIESCIFISNHGLDYGGGIDCSRGADANIVGCEFYSNTAISGGAIRSAEADAIISDCIIEYNTVTGNGGGINNHTNASAIINNCIIRNNDSGQKGGGIYVGGSSSYPQITGCLITYNASELGGGIQCNGNVDATISNCTIVQNQALGGIGGGITFYNNGHADVFNSILWNNVPGEIEIIEGSIDITYSDIDGGWPGTGNIDDDPFFVNPGNDDYHLLWGSPCIDAGDPTSPLDPDSTRADMGAYYFDQGPLSALTVVVVPDTNYYHKGDHLGCTVHVSNNTDTTIFFQGWTEGETPWGEILSPLLGPVGVVLGGQQTVSPHIGQKIPNNTPFGGPYIYTVVVGIYPNSVYAEDSFEFFVVPPGIEQQYEDWEVIEGGAW